VKRVLIPIVSFGILALLAVQLRGVPQNPPNKLKDSEKLEQFMQMKLEHSQAIMQGLATEDFELIAKEAQQLLALSLESSWEVHTTQAYLDQSSDFRRSLHLISEAAHEENLDRAALGYMNLTVHCIECHRYLRKHHPE
jgi:hypothetical protein